MSRRDFTGWKRSTEGTISLLEASGTDMETSPRRSGAGRSQVRRALSFVAPHRKSAVLILALAIVGAALAAVEPLVLKQIFDALGAAEPARALGLGVLALLGISAGRELVGGVSNWFNWRVRLDVQYGLLEATVGRLNSLSVAFHRAESVGGTLTRLDRGIAGFVGALSEIICNVLPALTYLGISLFLMFSLDWRLSALVLAFTPVPALIGAWAAAEQSTRERRLLDRWVAIYSRFNEVLGGIVTVKSYTMEEVEKHRFLTGVREANQVVARGVGFDGWVSGARNQVASLARVAAIAFGCWLVIRGQTTVGTVVAFLGYVGGLFGPVQGLTNIYATIRRASAALETIFSILDAEDDLGDLPDAVPAPPLRGDVFFDRVEFAYTPERDILRGIDLRVRAGEVIALVGPSGGGKSTMMALLQRLYDPSSGRVLVDGIDVRTVRQRSLRQQIGVVLQDALLFNDTVRNNIAYGRPGASLKSIEDAAKAANAHDMIVRLPDGYDALVGERGGLLSVGERQRVAIARALLKDPPILILDEATSALDAESEALVQEALTRLVRGRTTFIIAHRLSTVVGADRILVLKDGRISESGTHRELMRRGGYYSSLVDRQTRGLIAA